MFLTRPFTRLQIGGFPRVRGDVPKCNSKKAFLTAFSPRARGCSFVAATRTPPLRVFPACAGMFLWFWTAPSTTPGFPRVRGDVPCPSLYRLCYLSVFPACAGMFRCVKICVTPQVSFPRVRGDVPTSTPLGVFRRRFSPRARGCSLTIVIVAHNELVFPACAGMFRFWGLGSPTKQGFPRVRGDVPPIGKGELDDF